MKKMNKRKISLILIGVFILVTIGLLASKVTLSYLGPKVDEDKKTQGEIGANGNRLIFTKGTDITINANMTNFGTGKGNLTKSMTSSVEMIPADKTKAAFEQYMALINIPTNTFKYTTSDKKPEVILTIKDENNQIINSIEGLTYVTAGDVQGFDITEKKGGFTINDAKDISTAAKETSKKHNWQFTVTLINLGTDQSENGNAELKVEGILKSLPDVVIGVKNYTMGIGKKATFDCDGVTGTFSEKYDRLEISQINDKVSCNINYTERTNKTYLNDYVVGLAGNGQVYDEKIDDETYANSTKISQSEYKTISQFSNTDELENSGTAVTNAFSFVDGKWKSNPSNMESKTYYHLSFILKGGENYQLCYDIVDSDGYIRIWGFDGNDSELLTITNSSKKTKGCINLGYVEKDTNYRIVQYGYRSSTNSRIAATAIFYIQKGKPIEVSTGYRYEGKNPDNYVLFNDELWRIIGVFNDDRHGVANKKLVKIIRNESIGGFIWNKVDRSDWANSSLKAMLNDEYLNSFDGSDGDNCYTYDEKKGKCDFTANGIKDKYKGMIKDATWYLGHSTDSVTATAMYKNEKSTEKYQDYPLTIDAKIGLMYGSDYGYASPAKNCSRTTSLREYWEDTNCSSNNWLYTQGDEWILTPGSSSNMTNRLYMDGSLYNYWIWLNCQVRPVLYLDESVFYVSGDGSNTNPYIIGM